VKPGGGFEPWFGQLVSLARVDAAVNVDALPADATAAAAELGINLVSLANIDRVGLSAFTVHPSVTGPAHQDGYIPYAIPREGAALWEVVGAGDLTAEHLKRSSIARVTALSRLVVCESGLELARIMLAGFDSSVTGIAA